MFRLQKLSSFEGVELNLRLMLGERYAKKPCLYGYSNMRTTHRILFKWGNPRYP